MDNLLGLFCLVDDFCKEFMPEFEKNMLEVSPKQRHKDCSLNSSEIMIILIYFHQLRFRYFKTYYIQYVQKHTTTDDPVPVSQMTQGLEGKLFGDKGYISQKLFDELYERGLQLITKIKKNMKNKLMPLIDKLLLGKRAVIESINDQLKNISQIEHSRHRSTANFIVNLVAGLAPYTLQPKKPSLDLHHNQLLMA